MENIIIKKNRNTIVSTNELKKIFTYLKGKSLYTEIHHLANKM